MSNAKPKIVVVGPGNIGASHTMVVSLLECCALYGICDVNPAVGEPVAEQYGVKFYPSVEEVCADPEVDGAIVCVPDQVHLPVCAKLARAGKHILVEKPIAYTSKEGEELRRICAECGVAFSVAQCTEFIPGVIVAREQVKSGAVGDIVHFMCRHITDTTWGDRIKNRAHLMFYLGVHDIYNILTITGLSITKAFARQSCVRMKDYHDAILCVFTLENGAVGSLEVAWDMAPDHGGDIMEESFFGIDGTLSVDMSERFSACYNYCGSGRAVVDTVGFYAAPGVVGGAFPEEDREFVARILEPGKASRVDTDVAIEAVRVIEAVFRSLESGREEDVVH